MPAAADAVEDEEDTTLLVLTAEVVTLETGAVVVGADEAEEDTAYCIS